MTTGTLRPEESAIVYTCDDCEREYFPQGTVATAYDDTTHVAIVHEHHAAEYMAAGFHRTEGIVTGTDIPGLFCPHVSA
jgi:formate dehydrogenase assembly factor FdhD